MVILRLQWNSGGPPLDATSMHSVRTKYLHPRNIRGQHSRSPLEVNEDNARLNPHFLPYDGLWIASDKVLVGFSEVTVGLALNPTFWDINYLL